MIITSIIKEEKMEEIYEVVFAATILHTCTSFYYITFRFLLELLWIELPTIFCNY